MSKRRVLLTVVALALAIGAALVIRAIYTRPPPVAPKQQVPPEWQEARQTAMHALHVGEKKIPCSDCHDKGWTEPAGDRNCARCHGDAASRAHVGNRMSPTNCLTCHAFAASAPAAACTSCHGLANVMPRPSAPLPQHARMGLDCAACHDLHAAKDARAKQLECAGCHQGASAKHGKAVAPASDAAVPFDAAVLAFARDAAADAHAAGMNAETCATCHAPHTEASAATAGCATCHVASGGGTTLARGAPTIAPRGRNVAGHPACVTCHDPHDARRETARPCAGCHADRRAAATIAGHAACTSCHAPHAPAEAKTACATCHANVHVLGATRVPQHASCTSCHDPHRPNVAPAAACQGCHAAVSPKHPAAKTGACTGCHDPHPKDDARAVACASCHTKAKNDRAFHAGAVPCLSCHRAHEFSSILTAGASACAGCHVATAALVEKRPGHADCKQCHGAAHAPNKKPDCQACHATEARTAPRGHAQCTSCHDGHSGSLGKHASCTSCHTNKASALHASVATGCASCHRPHGPNGPSSPPACTSCHERAKLPGLHARPSHARCETCHGGHRPPTSDRATCTTGCHQDKRNHQPGAALCKGCHLFGD